MQDKEFDPPPISINLIKSLCKEQLVEEIEGNLIEYYSTIKNEFFRTILV